jgi:hypothetical protein
MLTIPDPRGPGPRWAHVVAWVTLGAAVVGMVAAVLTYRGPDVCPCGMAGCPPWPNCDLLEGGDSTRVLDTTTVPR